MLSLLFPNFRYTPFIMAAIGIGLVVFGIIGNAHLVLLGGAYLCVWTVYRGRNWLRGDRAATGKFGGRR